MHSVIEMADESSVKNAMNGTAESTDPAMISTWANDGPSCLKTKSQQKKKHVVANPISAPPAATKASGPASRKPATHAMADSVDAHASG